MALSISRVRTATWWGIGVLLMKWSIPSRFFLLKLLLVNARDETEARSVTATAINKEIIACEKIIARKRASIIYFSCSWKLDSIDLPDVCRFGTLKFSPIQLCRKVHKNFHLFWVCHWEPYLCRICVQSVLSNILHNKFLYKKKIT